MHKSMTCFRSSVCLLAVAFVFAGCDDDKHVSSFSDAVDVCVGADHSCAVHSSGKITCWGSNRFGESSVPNESDFTAVSCTNSYTCGLKSNGSIRCWGREISCAGTDEVLGDPATHEDCFETPALYPPQESGFQQLVVGGNTGCALRGDGSVLCWGDTSRSCFDPPSDGKQYIQIAGDGCGYCGLEASGEVDCGTNDYLQSPPDVIEQPRDYKPLPENVLFSQIVSEGSWACGIRKDDPAKVYCWGRDVYDNLTPTGDSWNEDKIPVTRIDSSLWFKCILRQGQKYKCFGQQGGFLTYPPSDNFVKLAMEGIHGCGVLKNGHVRCWGDDYKGKSSPP